MTHFDRNPTNQSTPACGPQPTADNVIDNNATTSNNGNAEPVHQTDAEAPVGPGSTDPHREPCHRDGDDETQPPDPAAPSERPHGTVRSSAVAAPVSQTHAASDRTPYFVDQEAFLHHVGSQMQVWRGFLYNAFPSLHWQLYAFADDVICQTLKRCTYPANTSHYSHFNPAIASFTTWFCWKLKGVALDVWKRHYKRKRSWEAQHDATIRTRDDYIFDDDAAWHESLETKGCVVPSVTYTPEWEQRLDLQQGFDALALHLTPAERDVLYVMLTESLEYKDIARVTDKTAGNVGVIVYRIRKKATELASTDSTFTLILDTIKKSTSTVIKEDRLPYNYNKGRKKKSVLDKNVPKTVSCNILKSPTCSMYVVDIPGFAKRWDCYSDDERQDAFYDFNPDKQRPYKGRPHGKAGRPDLAADPISSAIGPLVQFPYAKLFPRGQ